MSRAMRATALLGMVLAATAAHAAAGAEVVVYRCVAADGAVTLQNDRRCPKGSREQRRVIEVPTSRAVPVARAAPAPAPASPITAPAVIADPVPVVEIPRTPPPALFACRTWEGTRYFGEAAQPAARCAPLETVGLDRRSEVVAQSCEVVADTCEPVAEPALCDAWADRLRAADDAARFGDAAAAPAAETEAARIRDVLAASTCAR